MKRKFIAWVVLLLLLSILIIPVFKSYVPGTNDGLGQRFRLVSFYRSLSEGNLRPRWAKDVALGYGAPLFIYNYPLPYYIGSVFLFLTKSINISDQFLSASSLFFSGIFMYLAVRKITGSYMGSLTAAILYTAAPYHLMMNYLYDAYGEEMVFVFPPLILYFFFCLFSEEKENQYSGKGFKEIFWRLLPTDKRSISYFILLTFSWVLFILCHNLSALIISPVLLFLGCIGSKFQIRKCLIFINTFFSGVILSAFFWLPALLMQNEIRFPQFAANEINNRWFFFRSISLQITTAIRVMQEGIAHYQDFTIGLPIFGGVVLGLIIWGISYKLKLLGKHRLYAGNLMIWLAGLFFLFAFFLFLSTPMSDTWWSLPFIIWLPPKLILYPFRFLFAASFTGALLIGIITKYNYVLAIVLIIFGLIQGFPYIHPYVDIFPFPDSYFTGMQTVFSAPHTRKNMIILEHLPRLANLTFLEREEEKYYKGLFGGNGNYYKAEAFLPSVQDSVQVVSATSNGIVMNVKTYDTTTLTINRFYFPDWQARIDGHEIPLSSDSEGRMILPLLKGGHTIDVFFDKSKIEKLADIISYSGLIILCIEIITVKVLKKKA